MPAITTTFALVLSMAAAELDAPVAARGEGWMLMSLGVDARYDADMKVDVAYTGRKDEPNVAFLCDDKTIRVRIGTEPGTDLPAAMRDMFRARDRIVRGSLSVDGEEKARARGVYHPAHRIVVPEGRKTAAAVFNAVASGQPISYRFRRESVTYALPPMDDALKTWVRGCKARGAL